MYQPIYASHQSYKQTNVSLVGLHPTSKTKNKISCVLSQCFT